MICFLFCRRGLPEGENGSVVEHLDFAIALSGRSTWYAARGARTGRAMVFPIRAPKDAPQRAAVIDAQHASVLIGREWLEYAPLQVGQIVSAHASAESA